MSEEGGAANDDTVPASDGLTERRSSVPVVAPPPDARYRLGEELGRGGMGRVVEAFDTHLQRTVALKEVLPSAGNIERRFQREVRITARLEHAAIVPLYDSGRLADGRPFYVMRRVSGKPLDEVIARAKTIEERLGLLPNVLSAIDAVAHAHTRGVVHRDIKPQNILVGELGETVVIDWGLAKVIGDSDEPTHDSLEPRLPTAADSLQTQVGSVFGTPGFMAPEQARGDDLGPQADVYALGATLYQMVVGKPPFGGKSATDVITSTLRHKMVPVARAAPGAPAELVTIIEKALAFDAAQRYRDAGELGEDVRRFLTGQLVGAHRYTPRQRIARFARRNRAALIVAALAAAGIAVLASISVHNIVRERDAATVAKNEADRQRTFADERATQLRERADQLLLLYARSLVDSNPTHAFAVLKQVATKNGVVGDEAKAIARAALMRGVAWGIKSFPDKTISLEMTRDGKRVVQVTYRGDLQVVDLDTRRPISTLKVPYGTHALWVDRDRKLLIDPPGASPSLLDPVSGVKEPLAVTTVTMPSVTEDGSRVAAVQTNELVLIDTSTKQVTKVPMRRPISHAMIAPDGAWIACDEELADKRRGVVIVDPSGRVLAEREGSIVTMERSPAGRLVMVFTDAVYEIASMKQPVFARIPLVLEGKDFIHYALYRNEKPYFMTRTALLLWNGTDIVRFREFPEGTMLGRVMRDGVLAVSSNTGHVALMQNGLMHSLQLTGRPDGVLRIAAVPGSPRIVVNANDVLLLWNIDDVMPRQIAAVGTPYFASETSVVSAAAALEWTWLDIPTNQITTAPMTMTSAGRLGIDVAADDGRFLIVLQRNAQESDALIGYPNGKEIRLDIATVVVRLVEGGGVVYSPGKGRVMGKVGDEEARELVTLDGDVSGVARVGTLGYAAISKKGELVRGRFDGSDFLRTRFTDGGTDMFVEGEPDGSVLVAAGKKLLRWPASAGPSVPALEEVALFTTDLTWMRATPAGTFYWLADGQVQFSAPTGDRAPRRLPAGEKPSVSYDGSRVVSTTGLGELEILELPSRVAWTMPRMASSPVQYVVSPIGRSVYQTFGLDASLWTIPEPASDFPAWLDETTNAVDIDRHVQWPWQAAASP